jgi:hypothetical protein
MAAKAGFPLAGFEVLVSEDWVVDAPGLEPGTHRLRVRNNVVVEMGPHACLDDRRLARWGEEHDTLVSIPESPIADEIGQVLGHQKL